METKTEENTESHALPPKSRLLYLATSAAVLTLILILNTTKPENRIAPQVPDTEIPVATLPDFQAITDVQEKKSAFFDFMTPIIEQENAKVLQTRTSVATLLKTVNSGQAITPEETVWLTDTASNYAMDKFRIDDPVMRTTLLKRIDAVPVTLALSQAANETAWGTSRFARMGNNMFGQWSFKKGSGIVPLNREPGKSHEVAKFDSVNDSVRSYIHNLNTGSAYAQFRELRSTQRDRGETPDGITLAMGLEKYSERGDDYIRELQAMIRYNTPLMN